MPPNLIRHSANVQERVYGITFDFEVPAISDVVQPGSFILFREPIPAGERLAQVNLRQSGYITRSHFLAWANRLAVRRLPGKDGDILLPDGIE